LVGGRGRERRRKEGCSAGAKAINRREAVLKERMVGRQPGRKEGKEENQARDLGPCCTCMLLLLLLLLLLPRLASCYPLGHCLHQPRRCEGRGTLGGAEKPVTKSQLVGPGPFDPPCPHRYPVPHLNFHASIPYCGGVKLAGQSHVTANLNLHRRGRENLQSYVWNSGSQEGSRS